MIAFRVGLNCSRAAAWMGKEVFWDQKGDVCSKQKVIDMRGALVGKKALEIYRNRGEMHDRVSFEIIFFFIYISIVILFAKVRMGFFISILHSKTSVLRMLKCSKHLAIELFGIYSNEDKSQ